jgi:hypothetical protein
MRDIRRLIDSNVPPSSAKHDWSRIDESNSRPELACGEEHYASMVKNRT